MNILQSKHLSTTKSFLKWSFYGGVVGGLCGIASAIFLHGLDWVTDVRENHKGIIYFLPIAGVLTSYLYIKFGKNSSRGNNLILEEIQNKKEKIPFPSCIPKVKAPVITAKIAITSIEIIT